MKSDPKLISLENIKDFDNFNNLPKLCQIWAK